MQGARAPALASTRTSGNPGLQDGRATHGSAGEAPGNGGNDLAPTPSVSFLFFWKGYGNPMLLLPGSGAFSCVLAEPGRGRVEQPPHTPVDTRAVATRGCAAPTATADG